MAAVLSTAGQELSAYLDKTASDPKISIEAIRMTGDSGYLMKIKKAKGVPVDTLTVSMVVPGEIEWIEKGLLPPSTARASISGDLRQMKLPGMVMFLDAKMLRIQGIQPEDSGLMVRVKIKPPGFAAPVIPGITPSQADRERFVYAYSWLHGGKPETSGVQQVKVTAGSGELKAPRSVEGKPLLRGW